MRVYVYFCAGALITDGVRRAYERKVTVTTDGGSTVAQSEARAICEADGAVLSVCDCRSCVPVGFIEPTLRLVRTPMSEQHISDSTPDCKRVGGLS